MQSSAELESLAMMQKMLKQLRGSPDMFSQKLLQALAKGNFADASKALEDLRKKLEESNLTDEQRKALAEQLQKLAKQIQDLSKKNSELEKELEKLGLDKKLAKMSEKQMREALKNQGLNKQQIEELLKKAAACKAACKSCSKLGDAMAACGAGSSGLSGNDLAGLMDQLDQLQAMKDDLAAMQASLSAIGKCMGGLGEGMCQGMGQFKEGYRNCYGQGTGGPGTGYGLRDIDETGKTSTDKTKAKTKTGEGPVVASWYVKGSQVKGETRREFTEVVQAGRDSASEAIKENEIPRKYEGAVMNYFKQVEEAGGE
jgi:DNA polymerase III alpha subunit (gram-positive type)